LLTRRGCHLCEVAAGQVRAAAAEAGASYDEVDVDADRELRAEYGDRVPVVLIDEVEHGYGPVDVARLRRALQPAV
jgi:hypothetical protein